MIKILFFIFTFLLYACTSVETQEDTSAYNYEDEEEEEFLASQDEDEYDQEMEDLSSEEGPSATQSAELEEQEAEDELKEIEDEFAEFADEEAEYAESIGEDPLEEEVVAEQAEEPLSEITEEGLDPVSAEELETAQVLGAEEPVEVVEDVGALEGEVAQEETIVEDAPVSVDAVEEDVIAQEPVIEEETTVAQEDTSSNIRINNIRYENEQIHIDVTGGVPSYRSRFNEATRQFIVEIPNAVLMDNLRWPYIMKEFQSGFALLQADQKSENVVRIIIQMRPESPAPLIAETDTGGFMISSVGESAVDTSIADSEQEGMDAFDEEPELLTDETFSEEEGVPLGGETPFLQAATIYDFLLKDQKFYGKPITLDVRDAGLKDILYFLVEDSGINMIISNKIKDAKVNIQLKEVPWDQALFLIMKQNDLAYVREGNVVTIAGIQDFEAMQSKLNAIKLQQEASAPLKLEIVPIAYAQAGNILSQINVFKTTRGNVQADSQNNALIIRDTEKAISRMKKLIGDLDRTPKQVMIAAKIVEASEDFSRDFGISWLIPGESITTPSIGALGGVEITPSPLLSALPSSPNAGTLGSNLLIGTFRGLGDLDVQLGFAETNGSARVLSSPRIMALNGQAASVNQSSESIAFSAVIPEGGGGSQIQIQRSPLQLSLQVTPEITNVDSIYMQVSVNRSSEGAPQRGQGGSEAKPVSNRSATTRILVKSGQTAVIGGIYETREVESLQGVPFLQHIPVVSWLFSQLVDRRVRTELLLFLTPRIIDIGKESADVASNN
ncbi:MAG: type IV pilus secretin PilQ [Bdellovibrionales bacterium]|nr:type IV pilus secretin PilQ [Bdellovibrionales bacterium]